jgi:hypothetical protein
MISLSPSAIGTFKDCQRCFYIEKREGLKVPRGIFPSLPGGMDATIKTFYDQHRAKGTLPPEIVGSVPGKLYANQPQLNRWRFWRTGLVAVIGEGADQVRFSGAIDDILVDGEGEDALHHVLDYKTRRGAPKDGGTERYYGHQADGYGLLFEANGMRAGDRGFFAYYFPEEQQEIALDGAPMARFRFGVEVKAIEVSVQRAEEIILAAAKCLAGSIPKPPPNCEVCSYGDKRRKIVEKIAKEVARR